MSRCRVTSTTCVLRRSSMLQKARTRGWHNMFLSERRRRCRMATAFTTSSCAETSPELRESVRSFLARPARLLIDGQWKEAASGETFEVLDPATGQQIASVAKGAADDIDLAVEAARRAFTSGPWSRMLSAERGRLLHRLA